MDTPTERLLKCYVRTKTYSQTTALGLNRILSQIIQDTFRCSRPFLNSSVDEAPPAYSPVRVSKEDVALSPSQVVQSLSHKSGCREEPAAKVSHWMRTQKTGCISPSTLCKLIVNPVVKDLDPSQQLRSGRRVSNIPIARSAPEQDL